MSISSSLSLASVYAQLTDFANLSNFWSLFDTAFGSSYDFATAAKFKSQWQRGNFSLFPQIEIISNRVLGTANGSYVISMNKIYLSDSFISSANQQSLEAVILEEFGHFVDAKVNNTDTLGDEGELFAAIVRGVKLSVAELSRIKTENDHSVISLNEQLMEVEQSLNTTGYRQFGTTVKDFAYGVSTDSSGNIYLTGDTYGSLATSLGLKDGFIAKYNASGTQVWIKQFGSANDDDSYGIITDNNDNTYVTGSTKNSLGTYDVFIAKYNTSGTQAWIKQFGTSSDEEAYKITADSSGNIYVTGYTNGSLPGFTNLGGSDAFVAKYNSSGTQLWLKQFGFSSNDNAKGISTDNSGNVYITGYTDGIVPNSSDAFIAKYNTSGTQLWLKEFGSSGSDYGKGVSTDSSGNAYVVGYTNGSLGGNISAGLSDVFITKYNASGTQIWTKQIGSSVDDYGYDIVTDSSGNIYISGQTNGSLPDNTNIGSGDAFVAKYDTNGNKLWLKQFGSSNYDSANAITINNSGNVYIAGETFGSLPGNTNVGSEDAFVVGFDRNGTLLNLSTDDSKIAYQDAFLGTLKTQGRSLYDSMGQKIVLRGVDLPLLDDWSFPQSNKLAELAKTGANAVRIQWYINYGNSSRPQYSLQDLDNFLGQCTTQGIIPILFLSDVTCQPNPALVNTQLIPWWTSPDVMTVLKKHQQHLIINLANELGFYRWVGSTTTALEDFKNAYKTAITSIRQQDLHVPLMIDAPDCGTSLEAFNLVGQQLINHDPDHNLLLSEHAYWAGYDGFSALNTAIQANLPIVFGEIANTQDEVINGVTQYGYYSLDGSNQGNPPLNNFTYQALLQNLKQQDIGWLAWSWWKDNSARRQMTSNGNFSGLTTYGNDLVNNATYGLKATAQRSTLFVTTLNGTTGNDSITGTTGNDAILPLRGLDTVNGGTGTDLLVLDYSGNTYTGIAPQSGIISSLVSNGSGGFNGSYKAYYNSTSSFDQISFSNIERFLVIGTDANDNILTGDNDDILSGGKGVDTLIGSKGNDIYVVDSATDVITENVSEGTDTIKSSITFSLATLPNIENLTLTGIAAINGTGNAVNNVIIGNGANNILTGAAGKDTLTGGLGSDRFGYKIITDSLLANFDVIKDFNANANNDLFLVTTARTGFTNAGAVATLDNTGIIAKLTTANFGANSAAQFTFGTRSFVAINDGTAGFSQTTDAIIEVTGLSGTLGLTNFVTV